MRTYENTFVIDAQLPEEAIREKVSQVQGIVSSHDGKVLHLEEWGNRKLAYEIKKRTQGYYVLMQLEASPEAIRELERALRLDESILRFLTVLIDEKAVKKDVTQAAEQEK